MNVDFTSSRGRVNSCCGEVSADVREAYRSGLELHRTTRAQTLVMAEELSQSQMDYQPAPHKWSVGEVLDHLILGQRLNLCFIAELIEMKRAGQRPIKKLSFADVDVSIGYIPKNFLPALETPFMMLNLIIPASFRDFMTRYKLVPAQNSEITTPRCARPAEELRNDLLSSFKETETLLEANADLDYGAMVIEHPLLGNNNIPGLLRFLALHEQRHQSQINDILAMPRFPESNLNGAGTS